MAAAKPQVYLVHGSDLVRVVTDGHGVLVTACGTRLDLHERDAVLLAEGGTDVREPG